MPLLSSDPRTDDLSMPMDAKAAPVPAVRTSTMPGPLGLLDLLGLAALSVVLFVLAFLQARHRIFWGDEIMGDYVLRAGSWSRFLELWRAGIDSSGIWFYVLAKPWEWAFGPSELSLRLFSATGVIASAVLIWVTARRFYPVGIVAVAVLLPYLDLNVLRWQLSNGRCYGVLMGSVALVLFLVARGEEDDLRRPRPLFLAGTLLAYDLVAGSHILGLVFAGFFLAVQMVLDLRARRFRPWLYLAAVVGIAVVVLFSLPNIRSTTALGKPVFWTERPLLRSLLFLSPVTESPVRDALLTLAILLGLHVRRRPRRDTALILLLGALLLHLAIWEVSRMGTSIYVDRYLLPLTFALVLLGAALLTQLREDPGTPVWFKRSAPVLLAGWALWHTVGLRSLVLPLRDYTTPLLASLPPGLPVIDTDVASFVEIEYYHHGRFATPFLFPVDAGVTQDLTNIGGVSGFHEMENFQRLGLDAPDLQPTDRILSGFSEFVVLTANVPTSWFKRTIVLSGNYDIANLGDRKFSVLTFHVWRVRRHVPGPIARESQGE